MNKHEFTKGEGRTRVSLRVQEMGSELVVCIYNESAHIGAVAIGEYDHKNERASTSVITRLGHKDDAVAQKAAYLISRSTHQPSCVIAGIHLDRITRAEIDQIVENATSLVKEFVSRL